MNKLFLLGLITLITLSTAKMVDGIAAVVEGEPVTIAELNAVQQQMQISKKKAMDLLIQDRLQQSAMRDIQIGEKSIDAKIASIATQNNLTIPKMQKILEQQGTSWSKYRSSIRNGLKKQKFYQEKVIRSISTPSEDELKLFYNNHQEEFIIPETISMVEYSAPSEAKIKKFLETKNAKGIKSHSIKKATKELGSTLLAAILQTQDGSFTRPFNAGDRYISYKVLSKEGETNMPFEAAKEAVAGRWKQQQQHRALEDYFKKLKTNADIQILR